MTLLVAHAVARVLAGVVAAGGILAVFVIVGGRVWRGLAVFVLGTCACQDDGENEENADAHDSAFSRARDDAWANDALCSRWLCAKSDGRPGSALPNGAAVTSPVTRRRKREETFTANFCAHRCESLCLCSKRGGGEEAAALLAIAVTH